MRIVSQACVAIATAAALAPAPACAELTAQDLWESWQSLAARSDQSIAAVDESYAAGVLTLSEVTTAMDLPEGGRAVGTLPELVLTERDDGSVGLSLPAEYPVRFYATGPEGETLGMEMTFRQTSLELVASGGPGAIDYAFSAPVLGVVLDQLTTDGEPLAMRLAVSFANADGTYGPVGSTGARVRNSFAADTMAFQMNTSDPTTGGAVDMTLTVSDLESRSSGTISPFAAGQDLAALLRDGGATEGRVTTGSTSFSLAVETGETPFAVEGSAGSGEIDMTLDDGGMQYSGANRDLSLTFSSASMPLPPLSLAVSESRGEIRMPLVPSEEPKDFGLAMALSGLTLGDGIWAMIDPTGQLARDAADLALELSGRGRWTVDISDPEAVAGAESEGVPPGEIEALSLDRLVLSFLGASLRGSGAFGFDNDSVPPIPSGEATFRLANLAGALQRLVDAGIMSNEQSGAVQLFAQLYAQPDADGDTLVSTIELGEDGSVFANGQRIR